MAMEKEKVRISAQSIKKARKLVDDLRKGGEAGLAHLGALSTVIRSPIKVLEKNGNIKYIISQEKGTKPISIQYQSPTSDSPGHWTLPRGVEPKFYINTGSNNCLFNVIAEQIKIDPNKLRRETLKIMEKNVDILAKEIDDIERFQRSPSLLLVLGGSPRYRGSSPLDSARVLDRSEGVAPHGYTNPGHPRGHVSNPNAGPNAPSVENYSRSSGFKSGFFLVHDQDYVVHHALLLPIAQNAMDRLNGGSIREVIHIPHNNFNSNVRLPEMGTWSGGEKTGGPFPIDQVTMVLGHHQNEINNPDADVHVQTCYPRK